MTSPTADDTAPRRRSRASRFGRKPNDLAAARTFSAVCTLTYWCPPSARDAVFALTPASAATSLSVGRACPLPSPFAVTPSPSAMANVPAK
jgi:hypothetical protein